ncbi:VOC family protein [Pseudomonas aeruginosa]|uniref:VOC family protein n=1 Tax=Pseudomonas aeruginosa TaxID=287 RepID=UPI003D29FAD6
MRLAPWARRLLTRGVAVLPVLLVTLLYGEDGQVLHAELTYASPNGANGMLMLGSSVRDNAYGRLMRHVDEAGGNTQSLYLVVADPDALFRSAQAAGAEIVIDIKDEDYGGRGFTCRDPEGHVWSFGSYDPWA